MTKLLDETAQSPESTPRRPPTAVLGGIRIHVVTEEECGTYIIDELAQGRGGFLVTPNLNHLSRGRKDPGYVDLMKQADLVVADGMPLIWASRIQGTPLPERVPGSNLTSSLSAKAAAAGRSLFLLGGEEGTAERAAAILRTRHPDLRIAGTFYPPFGFEKDPAILERMTTTLAESRADIVYVALGSPKQEKLIVQYRHLLPNAWWAGVGISFSFICGEVKRAPVWVQRLGLEWTHRLMQEPKRLARRYLIEDIPTAIRLFGGCAVRRLTGKAKNEAEA